MKGRLFGIFNELTLSPISLIDLFPMLRNGYVTKHALMYLFQLEYIQNPGSTIENVVGCIEPILQSNHTKEIIEEEKLIAEIFHLREILKDMEQDVTINNVALLIFGAKINERVSSLFNNPDLHPEFIEMFLHHPKVDPLYISATQNSISLTNKYLDNLRSNKMKTYIDCGKCNEEVKTIIGQNIILRIFLCKEYFLSLPQDLFTYFLGLQIF